MTKTLVRATCMLLVICMTSAQAWDPAEIDDRHAKAEEAKGGLMYEASVGGQKFKVKALEE